MAGKPKITGAGFNTFAIIALFLILPFSIAQLTTLSAVSESQPYDNLTEGNPINTGNYADWHDYYGITINNIGDNVTSAYIADPNNGINQFSANDPYYCMWLVEEYAPQDPNRPYERTVCNFGYDTRYDTDRVDDYEGEKWIKAGQSHSWLDYYFGTVPYIGYSGDKYSFTLNPSFFNNLDDRDLGKLSIDMKDTSTAWYGNPDYAPRTNISFDYSIEFFYGNDVISHPNNIENLSSIKFDDFVYDGDNVDCGYFDPYNFGIVLGCYSGLTMHYDFTNFEVIELSEWLKSNGGNKSEISAIINIENIKNEDSYDGLANVDLPFYGDSKFDMRVKAKYSNPQQINFILKGGTFILGAGLFFLAVASTPYYDPVKNFFEGAK